MEPFYTLPLGLAGKTIGLGEALHTLALRREDPHSPASCAFTLANVDLTDFEFEYLSGGSSLLRALDSPHI